MLHFNTLAVCSGKQFHFVTAFLVYDWTCAGFHPHASSSISVFLQSTFANSCDGIDDVHYYCCASVWDRVALFLCCESVCCLTPLSEPRQSLDLVVCLSPVKLILLSNIPLHASKRDVCYPCFFFCGGLWCQLVMYIWYTNIYCCGDNKFGNLEVGN
jgi:hypothetical protein